MNCPSCGHSNPAEASFCMRCGARLEPVCPQCGRVNPPEAAYCISCGASVTEAGPPAPPTPAPSPTIPSSLASGRYQVRRFIGEGGWKRVYLAHDTRLDRDVTITVTGGEH